MIKVSKATHIVSRRFLNFRPVVTEITIRSAEGDRVPVDTLAVCVAVSVHVCGGLDVC